jgi:hypothetical protein
MASLNSGIFRTLALLFDMQIELELFKSQPDRVLVSIEEWRTISEHPLYEASTFGRFRNKSTGRILNGTKCWTGYVHVGFMVNGKQKTLLAHRVIASTFIERSVNGSNEVNHKNKIRDDNRASNLEWVTRSENSKHAKSKI